MNTKTKSVGRPAAQLVYPDGPFTIKQLHALNKRKVRWELSIRQHIERNIEHRLISSRIETVKSGKVGKPAHVFTLTKRGLANLKVKGGGTPTEAPVVDVAVETPAIPPTSEISLTEIVPAPMAETPSVTAVIATATTETATVSAS